MQRNGTVKSICVLILILCLTLGGVVRQAKAQESDAVTDALLVSWSNNELTASSTADAVQATAATYGRCVAENWYRLCSGQYQACDIRTLFASDTGSQAEAQYLYDLNTYWLLLVGAPSAAGTTTSAAFNPVVTSIQVASDGQTATATVVAGWTREEWSSDATKNQNTVDNNAVCTLALRYENGKWLITHEDCPDDDLRRAQFPTGTDFAALTQTVPAQRAAVDKHEKEAEAAWQQEVQHMRDTGDPRYAFLPEKDRQLAPALDGSATVSPQTSTYVGYYGSAALTYCNAHSGASSYNTLFCSYDADCQNFGSQCVWAGFQGVNTQQSIDNHYLPMISQSVPNYPTRWWSDHAISCGNPNTPDSYTWTSGVAFQDMLRANANFDAVGVQGNVGTTNGDGGAPLSSLAVGDLVRLKSPGHTMVVVAIDANHTYNSIYVSAHTTNWTNHLLSGTYSVGEVDLEHIVLFHNPAGA